MTNPAPKETLEEIEQHWRNRCKQQFDSPKSLACKKAEVEFFCGAMSALVALGYDMPTYWTVCLMSGRRIAE